MKFRLTADATFEAEGIDAALVLLARHLLTVAEEPLDFEPASEADRAEHIFTSGRITVEPAGKRGMDP